MNAEKIGVLVVTGVVAVLLALTLVRSRPEPRLSEDVAKVEEEALRAPRHNFRRVVEPPVPTPRSLGGKKAAFVGNWHVVRAGERLETIARARYGKKSLWKKIYRANRDQLSSPHRIREGMRLRIP